MTLHNDDDRWIRDSIATASSDQSMEHVMHAAAENAHHLQAWLQHESQQDEQQPRPPPVISDSGIRRRNVATKRRGAWSTERWTPPPEHTRKLSPSPPVASDVWFFVTIFAGVVLGCVIGILVH